MLLLHDFTNIAQPNIPISTAAPTHHVSIFNTHLLHSFFQKYFFKKFLSPFPGPQGLLPTIFGFPFSRYVPSNFFRRFDLFSHFLLPDVEPPDDRGQSPRLTVGVTYYSCGCFYVLM